MSRGRSRRPRLDVLLALCLLALLLAIALSASHGSHQAPALNPSAPLVLNSEKAHSPTVPTNEVDAQAQMAAQRFLTSYLPVLYGRRNPATITAADRHVLESLIDASPTPAASRRSHPRIAALNGSRQRDGSVLEIATIDDGISSAYRLVFTVARSRSGGAWQVTQIANY